MLVTVSCFLKEGAMLKKIIAMVCLTLLNSIIVEKAYSESRRERIVFSSDRSGNYEIYTMTPHGSQVTRLTWNDGDDLMPHWSPDGTKIAFISDRDDDWEIFVMKGDGTGLIKLTDNDESDRAPRWSPDGKSIAFHSFRNGNWEIYVMNPDGSNQKRLTNDTITQTYPTWLPEGNFLFYQFYAWQNVDSNWEIYRMRSDGTGPVNVTNTPNWAENYPSFSPDSRQMLFFSNRDNNWDLFIQNTEGSGLQKLLSPSPAPEFLYRAAWSPDGESIIYPAGDDLIRINLDGSGSQNLTNSAGNNRDADWTVVRGGSIASILSLLLLDDQNGGSVVPPGCPTNNAPFVREVVATRTTFSYGRDEGRYEGVDGLPGFDTTFWNLITPRIITLDTNLDGKYDGNDPIVLDAAGLPSYTTLLVAEGINEPDNDPVTAAWKAPIWGSFYSTGSEGSAFGPGEYITDLSQYNRNSIIWEPFSIVYPVLDHTIHGGATSIGFDVTDNPSARNIAGCPMLMNRVSPTLYSSSLEWDRAIHLELQVLSKEIIPNTDPDPAYRGGIAVNFFAQINGNYEAMVDTTFRIECGDEADTVIDRTGIATGGVLQCRYTKEENGDMVTITTVGSSFGTGNRNNPFVNPASNIPYKLETYNSYGGTIGDSEATLLTADTGDLQVQLWDSGSLLDDSFDLNIDGFHIGSTAPGQSNLFNINSLSTGTHSMSISVTLAPDDIGTYTVQLFGGATFSGGGATRSGAPVEGTIVNYTFYVP